MHALFKSQNFFLSYFKIMYYKKEFISAKINSILLNYFFSIFKFVFNYIPSENKIVIYYNILIDNIVCTCTDNKKVLLVISHSPFFIIHQHDENPACPRQNAVHPVSYTHLRAHETSLHLVCRLLLEKMEV